MSLLEGWKTVLVFSAVGVLGLVQANIAAIVTNPSTFGWSAFGISVLGIVLRAITTSPIFTKTVDEKTVEYSYHE
jgi:hypothetical protein